MKRAFITGITGQDGSYLAEFLLEKGYEVHGLVRRVAIEDPRDRLGRIYHLKDKLILHPGTLESYSRLIELFEKIQPDECYHLAAQSFVHESFEDSFSTMKTNVEGTHHMLSALKEKSPNCKFYFAASSEMFGKVTEVPQTEKTPFHPRSPYGISKVTGFELTRNYRESYGIFACSGILFNHESPRRGKEFVTRKITAGISKISKEKTNILSLGNLDAKRDWGHAKDYVRAMWMMLQQENPEDYIICTGETHSIRDFIDSAFSYLKKSYEIVDLHNKSIEDADLKIQELKKERNKIFVVQHPKFYRPAEVDLLIGNYEKARQNLKWDPKIKFEKLVIMMVESDLKKLG